MPRDAEAWLAERGIERDPIRVDPAPPSPDDAAREATPPTPSGEAQGGVAPTAPPGRATEAGEDAVPPGPSVTEREAQPLAV